MIKGSDRDVIWSNSGSGKKRKEKRREVKEVQDEEKGSKMEKDPLRAAIKIDESRRGAEVREEKGAVNERERGPWHG
ncbi:hypothetical protein Tco_0088416 [Tanacetum coccineum]